MDPKTHERAAEILDALCTIDGELTDQGDLQDLDEPLTLRTFSAYLCRLCDLAEARRDAARRPSSPGGRE